MEEVVEDKWMEFFVDQVNAKTKDIKNCNAPGNGGV